MMLITGCSGFVGFHLCNFLLKKNKKIIGIDNLNSYYDRKLKNYRLKKLKLYKNFKFLNIDLIKFKDVIKLTKKYKFKIIIHLAAQPGVRYSFNKPNKTLCNNINSFNNIIEIARLQKVKKFIYASSSSVYGNVKKFPFTEDDYSIRPISVYGASKFSNEIVADVYSKNYNLNCFGLRFFTVYGPYGRPDMAYYNFSLRNLRNQKIELYNKAKMLRDFTYIDDVIHAIIRVIDKINLPRERHVLLNIGKGKPDKLIDLVNALQSNFKKKFKIKYKNFIPKGDINKTYSNNRKIKKLLKWSPKISLDEGVQKFVDWFKKYY
jgi:UDP-glucuronate 4-epimerase